MESLELLDTVSRYFLAGFFSFVAGFYTWRIISRKKQAGHEVVFAGERFCATWWNHMTFRVFRATIWMICMFRVPFPGLDNYLGIINSLYQPVILSLGMLLLVLGFAVTVVSHYSLGKQWRSGIDPKGPGSLVTTGVYAYSRNPMFLGVATAQLGFFMALPSLFSLVCLLLGLFTLYKQTRAEETHLAKTFAQDYLRYQGNVRRWV